MDEYDTANDDIEGTIKIKVTFGEYGGICEDEDADEEDTCVTPQLDYTSTDIDGKFSDFKCSKTTGTDECVISLKCTDCNLKKTAQIEFKLEENNSYAHSIKVDVTSTSSVPDENS